MTSSSRSRLALLFVALPPGFKRDSAHQYGLVAGLALTEFLYIALLARALGPRDFGLLVLFVSAARICQGVTDLRIHEFIIRYAETARASGSARALSLTLARGLRLDLASTLVGFALALAITGLFPELIPGASEHRRLMLLAAVATTATWAGRYWSIGVFRLFHRVDRQAGIQLGGAAAKVMITALWFRLFGATADAALVIAGLSGGVAAAILLAAAIRIGRLEAGALDPQMPGEDTWPEGRAYLTSNFGIGLLETAYRELDVQLIGWLGSLDQVSLYRVAKTFAGAAMQVVDPVVLLLMPQFSRYVAEKRFAALRVFLLQVTAAFTAAGVVLGVGAHFVVPWLIPRLVGARYIGAGDVFRVILWCLVATLPLLWSHALCMALGRPQLYLRASIAGVTVLVALSAALIPNGGAIGAAWAYGGAQITVATLAFLLVAIDRRTPPGLLSPGPQVPVC